MAICMEDMAGSVVAWVRQGRVLQATTGTRCARSFKTQKTMTRLLARALRITLLYPQHHDNEILSQIQCFLKRYLEQFSESHQEQCGARSWVMWSSPECDQQPQLFENEPILFCWARQSDQINIYDLPWGEQDLNGSEHHLKHYACRKDEPVLQVGASTFEGRQVLYDVIRAWDSPMILFLLFDIENRSNVAATLSNYLQRKGLCIPTLHDTNSSACEYKLWEANT